MTGRAVVRPSRESFRALARDYTVVPVWREVLADFETPLSAYAKLVGNGEGFLLESVEHAERWGRFSFLGRDPARTFVTRGHTLNGSTAKRHHPVCRPTKERSPRSKGWARTTGRRGCPSCRRSTVASWVGSVTTQCARSNDFQTFRTTTPASPTRCVHSRDWLRRSTISGSACISSRTCIRRRAPPPLPSTRCTTPRSLRLDTAVDELSRPLPYQPAIPPGQDLSELPEITRNFSSDAVAVCGRSREGIHPRRRHLPSGARAALRPRRARRSVRRVPRAPAREPVAVHVLLAPSGGVGCRVVAGSARTSARQAGGESPHRGTRRRGRNEEHDKRMEAELVEHPKERAEHVMLVDLARNDLGRVVTYGSEHVEELMTLERYSHVMHMTSQVAGELADGKTPIDVLRATFPAGTVSGAPKVRAMEIIDELEPTKRGPYAGVVGYVDFSGNLDTAIAIRTMFWRNGKATLQAGAGIVADSVPADEDLECQNKARALLTAAAAAQRLFDEE